MKRNWSRVKVLVVAGLIALSASCSSQLQSPNADVDNLGTVNLQSLNGSFDVKNTEAAINANTVNYTFSDGQTLTLYALDRYVFVKGSDTSVALRSELPAWINETERQLSSGSVQPQGVGMSPGAKDSTGKSALWPSAKALGVIYYEIGSFPPAVRTIIDQAIAQWNATSVGIKWQPRPWGSTYKYATIVGGNGSSLFELGLGFIECGQSTAVTGGGIGYTDPGGFPVANTIYLNPNCFANFSDPARAVGARATVIHEMGHATGLWHEQQRCGRGDYVTVPGGGPFDIVYIYNAAEKCNLNSQNYGYYDFNSVMHYRYDYNILSPRAGGPANSNYCGSPAFNTVGVAPGLSPGDINAINRLYSRGPVSTNNGC